MLLVDAVVRLRVGHRDAPGVTSLTERPASCLRASFAASAASRSCWQVLEPWTATLNDHSPVAINRAARWISAITTSRICAAVRLSSE